MRAARNISAYMCRCRSSRRPAVFTDARVASGRTFPSCSVTVVAFLRQSYNKAAERGTRPAAAAYQPDLLDAKQQQEVCKNKWKEKKQL